ncbi:hypothetical protein ES703_71842 [subsurface metagenome]
MMISLMKSAIFFTIGGVTFLVSSIIPAILPISVCFPVPTTTPCPRPRVMKVPLKHKQRCCPGLKSGFRIGSTSLSTGTDSPVSAASSALRFFTENRRKSAGTLSPPSSRTTSPGTVSRVATIFFSLSLSTVHSGTSIFFRASKEASAFPS